VLQFQNHMNRENKDNFSQLFPISHFLAIFTCFKCAFEILNAMIAFQDGVTPDPEKCMYM